ncbi:hypothetical protein V8E54_009951 [Elaphomyces granulatus]
MPATKDYVTAQKNSRTSGDAQQDTALGDAWVCSGLKAILCHTVGSGSNAKLVTYFLPDLFRDGEAIPASIDERPRNIIREPDPPETASQPEIRWFQVVISTFDGDMDEYEPLNQKDNEDQPEKYGNQLKMANPFYDSITARTASLDYGRGLSPSDYGFLLSQVESDNRLQIAIGLRPRFVTLGLWPLAFAIGIWQPFALAIGSRPRFVTLGLLPIAFAIGI